MFIDRFQVGSHYRIFALYSLFLLYFLFNFVPLNAHQELTSGKYTAEFDYDIVGGALAVARYNEAEMLYKLPDRIGNIYPDRFGKSATYEHGGRRKEDQEWTYHFDGEGFLVERVSKTESIERYDWGRRKFLVESLTWTYEWDGAGQFSRVKNNNKVNLRFEYDALGRRPLNKTHDLCHRYAWNGNALLHEWDYSSDEKPQVLTDELGRTGYDRKEPYNNLVTWVYDGNSYTPVAKLTEEDSYTIVQDYLGTPIQALDSKGELIILSSP